MCLCNLWIPVWLGYCFHLVSHGRSCTYSNHEICVNTQSFLIINYAVISFKNMHNSRTNCMWYCFVGAFGTHKGCSLCAYVLCKSLSMSCGSFHGSIIVVLYITTCYFTVWTYILFSSSPIDGDHVLCSFKPCEYY